MFFNIQTTYVKLLKPVEVNRFYSSSVSSTIYIGNRGFQKTVRKHKKQMKTPSL